MNELASTEPRAAVTRGPCVACGGPPRAAVFLEFGADIFRCAAGLEARDHDDTYITSTLRRVLHRNGFRRVFAQR